jgi:hypothetical protein
MTTARRGLCASSRSPHYPAAPPGSSAEAEAQKLPLLGMLLRRCELPEQDLAVPIGGQNAGRCGGRISTPFFVWQFANRCINKLGPAVCSSLSLVLLYTVAL